MVFNHYIVKNVLILFFAGIFIYYGTLVILRHYTHHGELLPVPDVSGMTIDEASEILHIQKMRCQLVDSVYSPSAQPGAVVSQNPEPGFHVKENRNVFLTVNALAPEKVTMPNVVGVSLRQAKTMLTAQGLRVGQITYVPDIARDYVLKQMYHGQEIRIGTSIIKGSEIDLVLGRGLSDERTPVPTLVGIPLIEARETLLKYFLNLSVIYDNTVVTGADSLNAFIFRQRPEASPEATLQLGSSIDVWVTIDQALKPDTALIPAKSE